MNYTLDFDQVGMDDLSKVSGKNASLGEMFRNLTSKGINVFVLEKIEFVDLLVLFFSLWLKIFLIPIRHQ